jgi:FAD/FMN-containing dehydrogenase
VVPIYWRSDPPDLAALPESVLPYGQARSYGDICLNDGGALLDTTGLNRFIAFDDKKGVLRCESGVTLGEILAVVVPRGWFPPVLPGTQYVSLGGAIANDVHGKNHHRAGSFGCHVSQFELLRSDGRRLVCSPTQNADFFEATIGGLGLTGLVLWAEFRLKRISGPVVESEQIRLGSLHDLLKLLEDSDRDFEYTIGWLDCLATERRLGRGVLIRGNHAPPSDTLPDLRRPRGARMRFDLPSSLLNPLAVKMWNAAHYYLRPATNSRRLVHYERFFFPLDRLQDWNRIYGRRGFLQYQCVIPPRHIGVVDRILREQARSTIRSLLTTLKKFGETRSRGLLSFPRPGFTLAMDFPYHGERTLRFLDSLDELIRGCGGAVYPAKDARMSPQSFAAYFPRWSEFSRLVDPRFSSSFWRRVLPLTPDAA